MFLATKIVWAGIALTLLTTGVLVQAFQPSPAASDSDKKGVAAFVIKDEITKMQEALRNKGHYQGKADGVFGLQTRASIRAYQKAENLTVTGQVDTRTAAGLGVRPESTWNNSTSASREFGHGNDWRGGEIKKGKPSAGITRTEGGVSKTSRKQVSKAPAAEDSRANGGNQP